MSVFGRVSGYLMKAHDVIDSHTPTSSWERSALDAVQAVLMALLAAVRRLHHRVTLEGISE